MFEGHDSGLSEVEAEPVDLREHELTLGELESQVGGLEAAEYAVYISHMIGGGSLGTNDYVVNEGAIARGTV